MLSMSLEDDQGRGEYVSIIDYCRSFFACGSD